LRVGDRSRGRFATPTDSPHQECTPHSHIYAYATKVRDLSPRSRAVFCRPVAKTLRYGSQLVHRCRAAHLNAVFCSVKPICSAMDMKRLLNTSRYMGSHVVPMATCRTSGTTRVRVSPCAVTAAAHPGSSTVVPTASLMMAGPCTRWPATMLSRLPTQHHHRTAPRCSQCVPQPDSSPKQPKASPVLMSKTLFEFESPSPFVRARRGQLSSRTLSLGVATMRVQFRC
jgi:hypothetical protein